MSTVNIKHKGDRLYYAILYTVLGLFCFTTVFPFIYSLVLSFNDGYDALRGGIYFWPRKFTLENYEMAFAHPQIMTSFRVTVLRTLVTTVLSVGLTAMMAYGLTEKKLPGRTGIVFYFFFTTLFSGGLIPTYVLYRQMGLINNFWVFVLPGLFSFYNTVIMRTSFEGIPAALTESARIDGAKEMTIFTRLIIPLSLPVFATIALFVGVGNWNDWFAGAFYIQFKKDLVPASTLLYQLISEASFESSMSTTTGQMQMNEQLMMAKATGTTPESLRLTFVIIIVTPILMVYPFLQRYFVKGVMIGSIKG